MPYLHCEKHGPEREAVTAANQEEYRQLGESVLIVKGTLISGPWRCDRCNAVLDKGDPATLHSAFPAHCREDLYQYDFDYEQDYFAMKNSDQAIVYGAPWPDDSITKRRLASQEERRRREQRSLSAHDLFSTLLDD